MKPNITQQQFHFSGVTIELIYQLVVVNYKDKMVAKHSLVPASNIKRYAAFLCFISLHLIALLLFSDRFYRFNTYSNRFLKEK